MTIALFLAVATVFLRAMFGTKVAELLQKSGDDDKDKVMANTLASQLVKWAQDGTLNGYLLTIVDGLPSAANLSENQKQGLANQIQVMLLSSVLAGLYKIKNHTQLITSDIFMGLLSNLKSLNDPNAELLATQINIVLKELPDDAKHRMLTSLSIYMNSNPNLPTLFNLGQATEVQLSIHHATHS